jgi:hypothetical protein
MNVAKGHCRTPLGRSEASVKGALQRARATLEARLPAAGLPRRTPARRRLAAAVETSDIDAVLGLLTSDAWLTMPPEPYEYQGRAAIARFLHLWASLRGAPLRLAPTRANPQPAFGCYRPCPRHRSHALRDDRAHPRRRPHLRHHLVLRQQRVPHFGLPRTLPR